MQMHPVFWDFCRTDIKHYENFQNRKHRPAVECVHRGAIIDHGTADRCGRKGKQFPIYSCEIHGECVIGAFCRLQKWQSCLNCSDYQEA